MQEEWEGTTQPRVCNVHHLQSCMCTNSKKRLRSDISDIIKKDLAKSFVGVTASGALKVVRKLKVGLPYSCRANIQ